MINTIWLSCILLAQTAASPPAETKAAVPASQARSIMAALETVLSESIDQASDSVVAISRIRTKGGTVTNAVRGRNGQRGLQDVQIPGVFNPLNQDFQSFDFGSGVIIGDKGEILTAFHVVQGADLIVVRAAGRQEFMAEIIAADPRSDLAVIMPQLDIPGSKPPQLKPVKLGNADKLKRGSFAIALGNPFNSARDGQASAAFGIVSNRSRRLDLEENMPGRQLRHLPTLLQLDSKLNLGMSGGAILNLDGELIGITTTGGTPQGFDAQAGYGIPIDALTRRVIATLLAGEVVEYGFLGVQLDTSTGDGNIIRGVTPNTPSEKAGMLPHDEIVAIGDFGVSDGDSLVLAVNALPVETPIKITLKRDKKFIEREVRLAKFPVTGEVIATNKPAPWRGIEVDYSYILNLGEAQPLPRLQNPPANVGPSDESGVLVTSVLMGSPADGLLEPGILIKSVNGKKTDSPKEFREVASGLTGKATLVTSKGVVEIPE